MARSPSFSPSPVNSTVAGSPRLRACGVLDGPAASSRPIDPDRPLTITAMGGSTGRSAGSSRDPAAPSDIGLIPKAYQHIHRFIHRLRTWGAHDPIWRHGDAEGRCQTTGPLRGIHPLSTGQGANHDPRSTRQLIHQGRNPMAQRPARSTSNDRVTHNFAHSQANLWITLSPGFPQADDSVGYTQLPAGAQGRGDIGSAGQPVTPGQHRSTVQTDRRLRPLARRAESTARPARVRIRRRNPWVFARRRLFGWKVRLLT